MTASELFKDIDKHLLEDEKPSVFLNDVYYDDHFKEYPFKMLFDLKSVEQSPIHHPEGNVWNHTLLAVDEAAKLKHKSKNQAAFMWAALLHDIGKATTTRERKGKITSYDHDKVGEELSEKFLLVFMDDEKFITEVSQLIRYHMQILFVVNNLPFADINGMKRNSDINEVALLGLCDRLGRTGYNRNKEEENIELFLRKASDG
ncbi:MAG: phosphohydrolase [Firmicutes bacterium HGW-Firmicutes-16]|nr:MAG: phosphohydrolase [Firmicutes bacterium HGW-Firmicutes-16]